MTLPWTTISLSGEAIFQQNAVPLLPRCEHDAPPVVHFTVASPATYLMCADYIDYVLEKEGDMADVIAETVRSIPFIPPANCWSKPRANAAETY
ncbi:MAG: hypothetical protein M2R45_04690 [Verrucomicrobia subdivision 3 bacterium]|nr:hypothetical protein [Limisphaerales bacterium]MCS1416613.1 hypothetical protein [Limisphaerales bacterium]